MKLSRRSALLIFLLCSARICMACQLSIRDQLALKDIVESKPPAGTSTQGTWAPSLQCASVGDLQIVSFPEQVSYHVLDRRRIFDRWSETGAALSGDRIAALRSFLFNYAGMDALSLWINYGRAQFTSEEIESLRSTPDLDWHPLRVLDRSELDAKSAVPLADLAQETLIQTLLRDHVRNWLAINRGIMAVDLNLVHSPINVYANAIQVHVSILVNKRSRNLRLRVPVNLDVPPFVGYARESPAR
jgi:hypothetical protein